MAQPNNRNNESIDTIRWLNAILTRMTDTPPEIAKLVHQKLMARSPEERFLMGIRMFDAARDVVLASLPKGLP